MENTKYEEEILNLIDNRDKLTRSDLQGVVGALVQKIAAEGTKLSKQTNEMKPKLCQRLIAPSDVNGNPRRVWVIYEEDGFPLGVIDEGYGGKPNACRGLKRLHPIEVSVKEYKAFMNLYNGVMFDD